MFLDDPVVDEVEVKLLSCKQLPEHLNDLLIVRPFLELEVARVGQQVPKLLRETIGELFDRDSRFLDFDHLVLLLLVHAGAALPWQATAQEVHQDQPDLFEIVPARLLDPEVRAKTRISGCSCELFTVLIVDVPARVWVLVSLGQSEIDKVDHVLLLAEADQEVVRFYVPVEETLLMDVFNSLQHLNAYHQGGLECELAPTVLEQMLKGRSQQVHDQHVVIVLSPVVVQVGYANWPVEEFIELRFVVKLRELGLDRLQFDCHLFSVFNVQRYSIRL